MNELKIKNGVKVLNCKYNNYGKYNKIIIPPSVTKIYGCFNNLDTLEEVIFETNEDNYTRAIDYSFNNCPNLNSIIFQNTNDINITNSFNKVKTLKKVYY